jgi:hypothetical protein
MCALMASPTPRPTTSEIASLRQMGWTVSRQAGWQVLVLGRGLPRDGFAISRLARFGLGLRRLALRRTGEREHVAHGRTAWIWRRYYLSGPTMFARIGVMRALNRHVERVFDPTRKVPRPTDASPTLPIGGLDTAVMTSNSEQTIRDGTVL